MAHGIGYINSSSTYRSIFFRLAFYSICQVSEVRTKFSFNTGEKLPNL